MKSERYYFLLLKDHKKYGVLHASKEVNTRFGEEVLPVENYEHLIFELDDGQYAPFMNSNACAYFANKELKQLIEENIPEKYPLEFLPIQVKSELHSDKIYYIIHFTKIFNVIDKKNSVYIGPGNITLPCIDSIKAKGLSFFNSIARINGFIVSDKFRKLMKINKLDEGIEFWELRTI